MSYKGKKSLEVTGLISALLLRLLLHLLLLLLLGSAPSSQKLLVHQADALTDFLAAPGWVRLCFFFVFFQPNVVPATESCSTPF